MDNFILHSYDQSVSNTSYSWTHLDLNNPESKNWLSNINFTDELISEALSSEDPRPRCEVFENGILIILRAVNTNTGMDPEDMVSIRLWIEKHRIISAQKYNIKAINEINSLFEKMKAPKTSGEFLVTLLYNLLNRTEALIDDLTDKVIELEDKIILNSNNELRASLSDTRRTALALRRFIIPQKEAINKIKTSNINVFSKTDKVHFREISEKFYRIIEDLDLTNQRAIITQEELKTNLAEQSSKTIYFLSLITVIFLPLSFLTSLLGINVGGIPGANHKWAFLIVCSIMLLITIITIIIFKRKKWF